MEIHAKGRRTVLIIDEAQNLSTDVLEQVRLLTNLETTRRKLLQILLIGQPELQTMMARSELRQLGQRITARYHLTPLLRDETAAYIQHRLAIAGCRRPIMKLRAITRIHRLSGGIPRLINTISDRSLMAAYAAQKDSVDARMVGKAASEVMGGSRLFFSRRVAVPVLLLLILVALAAGWKYFLPKYLPEKSLEAMGTHEGARVPADSFSEKRQLDEKDAGTAPGFSVAPLKEEGANVAVSKEAAEKQAASRNGPSEESVTFKELLTSGQVNLSLKSAMSSVLQCWQKTFADKPGKTACDLAAEAGLRCYFERGNWTTILRINRPVVLELVGDNAPRQYVAVAGIQGEIVLLDFNGEKVPVNKNQIDRYWFGDFIFLWEAPPTGATLLKQGDRGPDVIWLRERLNGVEGVAQQAKKGSLSAVFDDLLKKRVMDFQRLCGIEPDGVVGEQTLIRLNTGAGGPSIPVLRNPSMNSPT